MRKINQMVVFGGQLLRSYRFPGESDAGNMPDAARPSIPASKRTRQMLSTALEELLPEAGLDALTDAGTSAAR